MKKTILSILFTTIFAATAYASISVNGTASISAEADIVMINANIRASNEDIRLSLTEQEELVAQITASLAEIGVTRISTSGFNIWESWNITPEGEQITVPEINNSLNIIVEDLSLLNEVIYILAAEGASNLHLMFDTSNRVYYEERVLELAIENAERRASTVARILGRSLGQNITLLDDGLFWGSGSQIPVARSESAADVVQHPGEVIISTSIRMTFE